MLDDHLCDLMRRAARERGQSLSAFLSEAGRLHLAERGVVKPFSLLTQGGSGVREGVELDRVGGLVAAEDEGAYHQLP